MIFLGTNTSLFGTLVRQIWSHRLWGCTGRARTRCIQSSTCLMLGRIVFQSVRPQGLCTTWSQHELTYTSWTSAFFLDQWWANQLCGLASSAPAGRTPYQRTLSHRRVLENALWQPLCWSLLELSLLMAGFLISRNHIFWRYSRKRSKYWRSWGLYAWHLLHARSSSRRGNGKLFWSDAVLWTAFHVLAAYRYRLPCIPLRGRAGSGLLIQMGFMF